MSIGVVCVACFQEKEKEKSIFSILLTYGLLHTFIVITGTASPFPGEYTIRKNRPQK